jgi:hypothetical protein
LIHLFLVEQIEQRSLAAAAIPANVIVVVVVVEPFSRSDRSLTLRQLQQSVDPSLFKPDPPTLGTIINRYLQSFRHKQINTAHWTLHSIPPESVQ